MLLRVAVMLVFMLMTGCVAPSGQRAPIIDHSFNRGGGIVAEPVSPAGMKPVQVEIAQHEADWRPQVYVVRKGDTLYSIAFNFGFDYRELAQLNGIQDPAMIKVGQEIRLFAAPAAVPGVVARPPVETRPFTSEPIVKSQPLVSKLPYSESAVAEAEKPRVVPEPVNGVEARPAPSVSRLPAPAPVPQRASGSGPDELLQWEMPAAGKVVAGFSENEGRKGVDIAGAMGAPVSASAPGKVVYSGTGLRGYGKLVIIKHNNTYLSAYAHNRILLVKEGQMVAKGQKIAEMGNTDASQVALHFEIRRLGKPVDPAKYLPLPRS